MYVFIIYIIFQIVSLLICIHTYVLQKYYEYYIKKHLFIILKQYYIFH